MIAPDAIRADVADAATIETLVEELSNPDEPAVLYAITMLEALDKRHLITPLLLQHESPQVRQRALMALASTRSRIARKWTPAIERMTQDADVDVRAAALRALAVLAHEDASALMRRHLDDPEPRVAVAAATALANSGDPADAEAAEAALRRLMADLRDAAVAGRVECAAALAHIHNPQFRSLLVPLLYEHDTRVVREAIRSARVMGATDGLFLPGLMSLLGHRALKGDARDTLVGYGETIVSALDHALRDRREHIWLRRHIPRTLALIPAQASMDALVAALGEPDGFLRYKAIAAIERLVRDHPGIAFPRAAVEKLLAGRDLALLQQPDAARQPAAAPRRRPGVAAGPRPRRQDGAGARPHLPPARPAVPDRRHRRGALRHRARRRAPARPGHRVPRQPARRPHQAPRGAAARRHAAGRQGAPRQRAAQEPPARARRHAGPARSRRGRRGGGLGDPLRRPGRTVGAGGRPRVRRRPSQDAGRRRRRSRGLGAAAAGPAAPGRATPERRSRPWSWWTACAPSRSSSSCRWTSCSASRPSAKKSGTRRAANRFAPARRRRTSSSCSTARSPATPPSSRRRPSSASTRCSRARPRRRRSGRPGRSSACASPPPTCSRCSRTTCSWPRACSGCCSRPPATARRSLRPADIGRDGPVVDAAMVLAQHPLFERASAPQLLALTSATVEVPLAEGASLFRAGDMPAVLRRDERGGRARMRAGGAGRRPARARRSASPRRSRASAPEPAPRSRSRGTPCAWTASRCSMCSATTLT